MKSWIFKFCSRKSCRPLIFLEKSQHPPFFSKKSLRPLSMVPARVPDESWPVPGGESWVKKYTKISIHSTCMRMHSNFRCFYLSYFWDRRPYIVLHSFHYCCTSYCFVSSASKLRNLQMKIQLFMSNICTNLNLNLYIPYSSMLQSRKDRGQTCDRLSNNSLIGIRVLIFAFILYIWINCSFANSLQMKNL